jgi:hypothetical protein
MSPKVQTPRAEGKKGTPRKLRTGSRKSQETGSQSPRVERDEVGEVDPGTLASTPNGPNPTDVSNKRSPPRTPKSLHSQLDDTEPRTDVEHPSHQMRSQTLDQADGTDVVEDNPAEELPKFDWERFFDGYAERLESLDAEEVQVTQDLNDMLDVRHHLYIK